MSSAQIRRAKETDAAELARLTSQLGYPASEASIRTRMCRMFASVDVSLLVAERPNGKLAGWIHGFLGQRLESDYRVEIGGLIVDERCRRSGIGRELVQAIENWAEERGATELSVRCREERAESHKFYESLSFRPIKTQRVFRKRLSNTAEQYGAANTPIAR
jgi:GNAT superfamily N-acetyltransferase